MPGNGGVVLCVQGEVFPITQQALNIELKQSGTSFFFFLFKEKYCRVFNLEGKSLYDFIV